MEQSPSWEANRLSASQESPRILWNPSVHCRIYKSLSPVPILSQIHPVHAPHLTFWRCILIIPSHLHLDLPSGLFPSSFPSKTLYIPLIPPVRATYPAHLILDLMTRIIFGEEYGSLRSSVCSFFFPPSCYWFPFRSEYSPQHPILKHPQPTFLPQCERPSFTATQNNRQNCISLYLYIFE